MFPEVFAKLKASTAVRDIVDTRIYRHGEAPQDTTRPYITWFIVVGTPENNLSDAPGMDRQTIQVDYWHQTDRGIVALATAGRDALQTYAHMTGQPVDERERETRLFHIAQTFDWFVSR
jgi:Protein of unknown function (DUF3168)